MSDMSLDPRTDTLDEGTVTYEDVRIVIIPEGPFHHKVMVSHADGDRTDHAVEHVAINTTLVHLDSPIWFIGADLDVGVPIKQAGETAWVWP
ncbi:hypothetical protein [Halegenticoccus soli]|uniref:hypothetical protein n=1 Tax=Halegenticoccus soli TaxID=1985678 RepID=UPI000C6E54DF|nr:hypothetical protein [Halegenticoccus soli]